ncbi:MAG: hypothetical protein QMD53_02165 [Actinomycetota bacterium]|nr:hypothetical protein [Actinomycetota bacterium]
MDKAGKLKLFSILNFCIYFAMVYVNYLAVALPLGGRATLELSDKYPSLFTPALPSPSGVLCIPLF